MIDDNIEATDAEVDAIGEILYAAGWRDKADALGDGLRAAIPKLRAALSKHVADDVVLDAERYRWLRRKVCLIGTEHLGETKAIFDFVNLPYPTFIAPCAAAELDAAIDAALLAAQQQKGDK